MIYFFHNKCAFGEYVHVYSVVSEGWSVKCSKITKFTIKIHPIEPQINNAMGN